MAGQFPQDVYVLADLGSLVKVLVEELDAGKMDPEKFVSEVREAARRAHVVAPSLRPRD